MKAKKRWSVIFARPRPSSYIVEATKVEAQLKALSIRPLSTDVAVKQMPFPIMSKQALKGVAI